MKRVIQFTLISSVQGSTNQCNRKHCYWLWMYKAQLFKRRGDSAGGDTARVIMTVDYNGHIVFSLKMQDVSVLQDC